MVVIAIRPPKNAKLILLLLSPPSLLILQVHELKKIYSQILLPIFMLYLEASSLYLVSSEYFFS